MRKEIISVIVPAYNAEKTIKKCLHSILAQTYPCIEIIVVNDGSKDGTKAVVEKLSQRDERIRLINIENGGVSHARNVGIEAAKGDYLTFVDADDYIDAEMYQCLIEIIKKFDVKIAHCSYSNDDENGNIISIVGGNGKMVIQNHDDAIACLLDGRLFAGSLCNKLYKTDLFHMCRLDESIRFNEDILMNFLLFDQVDSSLYYDKPFYHYVASSNSSTHGANGLEARKQWLYVSRKILELSECKPYKRNAEQKLAYSLLGVYRESVFRGEKPQSTIMHNLADEIEFYKRKGYLSGRNDRIQYWMLKHFPRLFVKSYFVYDKFREKKLDPEQSI